MKLCIIYSRLGSISLVYLSQYLYFSENATITEFEMRNLISILNIIFFNVCKK